MKGLASTVQARHRYYKAMRAAQSRFPALADRKYQVQRLVRRARGRPFELDFLALRHLPCDDRSLLIDVGANRGQSVDAMLLTTSVGRVWSFEPNPLLARRLRDDYRRQPRVQIWQLALGSDAVRQTLYVPAYRGFIYDGLASLDEENAVSWLRDRVYGYREHHATVERVECETRPLDSFNCDPIFIKIDVQGFEHDVVVGAQDTIRRSDPVMLVEAPDERLLGLLDALGLQQYGFDGARFVPGGASALNSFFVSGARRKQLEAGGARFSS